MAGQKFAGSFIGTVGFSALSGGVGAELTGGNFWKGAGQGAIVGLLNHSMHTIENNVETEKAIEEVEKIATILGLNGEATQKLIGFVSEMGKFGKAGVALMKITKFVARMSGIPAAGLSIYKFTLDPTTANAIGMFVNVVLVAAGPELSVVSGILDLTGVSDKAYNFLGTQIDHAIEQFKVQYCNFYDYLKNVTSPANVLNYNTFP